MDIEIEHCRCGTPPVCEPGPFGFREWDVCCLNCGTRSPVFHNRSEAIVHWNNRLREPSLETTVETRTKGVLDQVLRTLRRERREPSVQS
ncbi:MAG: hypothetical protein H6999_12470 [Hahellaceae bacterium]|nr:hypothetical protein [Hahellaceae bacterium]MCP5170557.1 hypothetical protein [Hahellaceae bacterium]